MINKEIKIVLKRLNEKGYEAFLVGGATRNYLLNLPIIDYDVCTSADPNAIKMIFNDYVIYDIGKKLGTIAVIINKVRIEITPYRIEGKYSKHRFPTQIKFTDDLKQDLKRRDFTINALAMDQNQKITDLFNGIDDLNNKIIRCINNPDVRFNEDGLRILRALRFKTKLNFTIEEKTKKSMFKNKDLLNYISNERKKEELLQILQCQNCFETINEYLPIFQTFMPFLKVDRQTNNFSNCLYTLSYLLINKKVNLKQLKYSKEEINLINTLIAVSDINYQDDYAFICALSDINQKHIYQFLSELHNVDLKERFMNLKKYMVTINDLKIDGNLLKEYGYVDSKIKQIKNQILDKIHRQELANTKSAIIKYLNNI